jgi:hypothetical protein
MVAPEEPLSRKSTLVYGTWVNRRLAGNGISAGEIMVTEVICKGPTRRRQLGVDIVAKVFSHH